jgi:hypothetical protein
MMRLALSLTVSIVVLHIRVIPQFERAVLPSLAARTFSGERTLRYCCRLLVDVLRLERCLGLRSGLFYDFLLN